MPNALSALSPLSLTLSEGMKTDQQFVNTLEDNIRRRGAPTKLISDRAQVQISNKVKDILRVLCISDWQSEAHQQHQTLQNDATRLSRLLPTLSLTALVGEAILWASPSMLVTP